MKKTGIVLISIMAACLCLAACKTNTNEQPENSQQNSAVTSSSPVSEVSEISDNNPDTASRQDEAENGTVTDENGIIGDGSNQENAVSEIVEDAVSGTESIADNAAEGLQSAGEDLKNGAENAAEGIRDGISNAVSDDDDNERVDESSDESSIPQ